MAKTQHPERSRIFLASGVCFVGLKIPLQNTRLVAGGEKFLLKLNLSHSRTPVSPTARPACGRTSGNNLPNPESLGELAHLLAGLVAVDVHLATCWRHRGTGFI